MASIRILIVDDFEGYRRFVCSTLQQNLECELLEASDGLAALERARQEKPDLIVLDIGLPGLNGIELGRRIRKISPNSRILYVSQEASVEVVQEALQLGALGYIVKADAVDELLIAVDAVLHGRKFIGRRFTALGIGDALRAQHNRDHGHRHRLPYPQEHRATDRCHEVTLYPDELSLVGDVASFVEKALRAENAVILVTRESRRRLLLNELERRNWDVGAATRGGGYTPLDVGLTLSKFMVNDWPDGARLAKVVGETIATVSKAAQSKNSRIAVYGECAPTLLAEGKEEAAIEVERLWDEMARSFGLEVLCGYVLGDCHITENSHIFRQICAVHSAAYSF